MVRGTAEGGGKRKHCATTTDEAINAPKLQGPGAQEAAYKMCYVLLSMAKRIQEGDGAFDKKPLENSMQTVIDNPDTGEMLRAAAARGCSESAVKLIDRWVDFRWRGGQCVKEGHRPILYYDSYDEEQEWIRAMGVKSHAIPSSASGSRR